MDKRIASIGLIFGSDTGNTEEITNLIVEQWEYSTIDVVEVDQIYPEFFNKYDFIIIGLSTWYDGDLQSDWEVYYDEGFQAVDFTGKTVAFFGLGDQTGYGEYFIDGVGILAKIVIKNGGDIIGKWPTSSYEYIESKAEIANEELFYGLAIDEDNEPEKTPERIDTWLALLKDEICFNN